MDGRRSASFALYGNAQEIDIAAISSLLGGGAENPGLLSRGDTIWVLGDLELSPRPFFELLEELWDVVADVRRIEQPAGLGSILRLVQHTSATDVIGPGAHIPANWVELLARFNGEIDLDQYVSDTEDSASKT